jgi:hypothetical protein
MKTKTIAVAAAWLFTFASLRADTSYLLIQGPFGAGGAEETFKWKVNYPSGVLQSGQDLLSAVFGSPSLSAVPYTDAYSSDYNYYIAGNGAKGVGYIDFGSSVSAPPSTPVSPFVVSFTLASTPVAQDTSFNPAWSYEVAGGTGDNAVGTYPNESYGNYAPNVWNFSNDGILSRGVTDGSFDAWVFGSTYSSPEIDGSNVTTADFVGATVINVAPEPSSAALLAFGMSGMLAFLKRRRD